MKYLEVEGVGRSKAELRGGIVRQHVEAWPISDPIKSISDAWCALDLEFEAQSLMTDVLWSLPRLFFIVVDGWWGFFSLGYWGTKGFRDFGPFSIKPKAHAEKEEIPEDEQREFRLPGYTVKDDPVLGRPKSQKGKKPRRQRQFPRAS